MQSAQQAQHQSSQDSPDTTATSTETATESGAKTRTPLTPQQAPTAHAADRGPYAYPDTEKPMIPIHPELQAVGIIWATIAAVAALYYLARRWPRTTTVTVVALAIAGALLIAL